MAFTASGIEETLSGHKSLPLTAAAGSYELCASLFLSAMLSLDVAPWLQLFEAVKRIRRFATEKKA